MFSLVQLSAFSHCACLQVGAIQFGIPPETIKDCMNLVRACVARNAHVFVLFTACAVFRVFSSSFSFTGVLSLGHAYTEHLCLPKAALRSKHRRECRRGRVPCLLQLLHPKEGATCELAVLRARASRSDLFLSLTRSKRLKMHSA